MAGTSVLKLVVDDKQYEASLKNARQGMLSLQESLHAAGKTFSDVDGKVVEYARAIGQMDTVSKTAKGRIGEMSQAFVELKLQYQKMADAEKQSPLGQAMSKSLDELKTRTINAKQELAELNKELNEIGDTVKEQSSSLFGENGLTGMLQVFGGNLMTKGFEMIASGLKDAWTESIKLAREGEGVRIAFERLNQPGLLDRLKEATHGTVSEVELMKQAIKFENFKLPLEDLATYLAFAQQKAKDTGESVDYMVTSITTGLGRQSKQILDNLGISAAELTKRMNEGADMTKAVADIIREEMAKAGDYVETAADRAAQAAAKATDEMEKFGQTAAPIAEQWGQTWNALSIGAMDFANLLLGPVAESIRSLQNIWNNGWEDSLTNSPYNIEGKGKPKFGYQGMGNLQRVTAPGGYVEVTDKNTGAVIGGQHFDNLSDTNSINAWRKGLVKTPKTGGSGKKNLPEYSDFSKLLFKNGSQDLQAEAPFMSVFSMLKNKSEFDPENILGSKSAWESYKDTITETVGSVGESFNNLTSFTKDFKPFVDEQKKMTAAAKQNQMAMGLASQAVNAFGSALAGMEDPGAKAAGTVMSAIASIALGFAMASSQANTAGTGWGWLAWLAAGIAAMATTISTVHSLTGYAQGGIVKGNSYSGDNIYGGPDAMVNAGELVLTKAQQSTLASSLQGNGMQNMNIAGRIKGTDIILSIDRSLKLEGKQLLTWGR